MSAGGGERRGGGNTKLKVNGMDAGSLSQAETTFDIIYISMLLGVDGAGTTDIAGPNNLFIFIGRCYLQRAH